MKKKKKNQEEEEPSQFKEKELLHRLKHYLPSQTPLKDFVHHNTLHAFQDKNFYEAIFKASAIFGCRVTFQLEEYRNLLKINRIKLDILERVITERKGQANYQEWLEKMLSGNYNQSLTSRIGRLRANWKSCYQIDIDNLVQPLLFRIICSYLDQGIAINHFPFENHGLLKAIRILEEKSFTSFFKTRRARALLNDQSCTIEKLLKILVKKEALFEQYLFDQQFSHRGWSGIISAIEDHPETILYQKKISLKEFIMLELLFEIDALDYEFGENWQPLGEKADIKPFDIFAEIEITELNEVLMLWQDAFEWSYYDEILSGVRELKLSGDEEESPGKKTFQAMFCIDERECSLRRHLEAVEPECETLGLPGYFGVEFYFHPASSKFYEKLCPVTVSPGHLVKEKESGQHHRQEIIYSKKSHTLVRGFLASLSLGVLAAGKLVLDLLKPSMRPGIAHAFAHMNITAELVIENSNPESRENGLQIGFTTEEMADRTEAVLRGIGLVENFSELVYVIAHGSSSANNPHHGAYDCGACSGRPGGVNARVFAFMANHPQVRKILAERNLVIPAGTLFIAGLHDTSRDELAFFDEKNINTENINRHKKNKALFEEALNQNAKERSRRFVSVNTRAEIGKVRSSVRKRSVSFFEPRPELGHGTNALCFVGHRNLTRGLFLDRRAFMNSYDYRTDPDGSLLLNVMKPIPGVCGGINLEYFFSRMDNYKLGANTKLSHNVMGLIGVANSSDGDLRPGLPSQMVEVHDPVRLLIVVEHFPEIVLQTIMKSPELYEWFINEWVYLIAVNPENNKFYRFNKGEFVLYEPLNQKVPKIKNITSLIESVKKMKTNNILEATKENINVHIITKE